MNDAAIVNVIEKHMPAPGRVWNAYDLLGVLRANGWELYRPEDCEKVYVWVKTTSEAHYVQKHVQVPTGTYHLVPETP